MVLKDHFSPLEGGETRARGAVELEEDWRCATEAAEGQSEGEAGEEVHDVEEDASTRDCEASQRAQRAL